MSEKNTTATKQTRFEKLLDHYAVALHLTYELLDSGLLESKVKIGNDTDKVNGLVKQLLPAFAADLREAEEWKDIIKSPHNYDKYFGSAVDIANAYFDELRTRGREWEYADLQDFFADYKATAEEVVEKDRKDREY